MNASAQCEVAAFLSDPANWGAGVTSIDVIETHGAIVYLGGECALKMKRAVRYDYMDFSTLERRRKFCEAELTINRRTAPAIYTGLRAVSRQADGRLAFGTGGDVVEWLVEMRRFDQSLLFDRLARSGGLTPALVERLTDTVAAFHASAERHAGQGWAAAMRDIIESNGAGLRQNGGRGLDPALVEAVLENQTEAVRSLETVLEARQRAGFVRRCHGDLHLGNIVLYDGKPTLFDAIEFNDAFAVIDVLYDLAFLIMDLEHCGLPQLANVALSRYLAHQPDLGGLALLPLYLSCRATVRAKVGMQLAALHPAAAPGPHAAVNAYLAYAKACFTRLPTRLIAVGGLSGSGKSTISRALAPSLDSPPGAIVLRSDVLRKRLFGRPPTERLGPDAYTPEVSRQVYGDMLRRARQALAAGRTAVVDAVYARPEERAEVEKLAADSGVPFFGFWFEAPPEVLLSRIAARHDDASDADAAVLSFQRTFDIGELRWTRIDTSGELATVVAEVQRSLARGASHDG